MLMGRISKRVEDKCILVAKGTLFGARTEFLFPRRVATFSSAIYNSKCKRARTGLLVGTPLMKPGKENSNDICRYRALRSLQVH